ncbi:MAG: polysaccharide export outer membrane protein [Lentimonas sp.]|jgi:polysaccharide export outer membrane protein
MKQRLKVLGLLGGLVLTVLSSCTINSHIMFKSPLGEYAELDSLPIVPKTEYAIGLNDKIIFSLSTNNGQKQIEGLFNIAASGSGNSQSPEYVVRPDSTIELPLLGKVKVVGLSVSELEDFLENKFSKTYKDPFVQANVTNKRVIVFPGTGGSAKVINLINENTTLIEVIALAGGIPVQGKANSIKLMRKVNGERKIYNIDLSTIEGLPFADMVLQANDYIYVEPKPQLASAALREIAPIFSLLSSVLVVFTILTTLK